MAAWWVRPVPSPAPDREHGSTREMRLQMTLLADYSGFDQTEVSRKWNRHQLTFAIRGKFQAGADVFNSEFRKVLKDFFLRHTGGEIIQNIVYRYPHPANTRLATSLIGFNCNDVLIAHFFNLPYVLNSFSGRLARHHGLARRADGRVSSHWQSEHRWNPSRYSALHSGQNMVTSTRWLYPQRGHKA